MTSNTQDGAEANRPSSSYRWLGNRNMWLGGGLAAVAIGLAFKWEWLTAVGAAPIILSALPCLVMCALGLCMRGGNGRSCHGTGEAAISDDPAKTERG